MKRTSASIALVVCIIGLLLIASSKKATAYLYRTDINNACERYTQLVNSEGASYHELAEKARRERTPCAAHPQFEALYHIRGILDLGRSQGIFWDDELDLKLGAQRYSVPRFQALLADTAKEYLAVLETVKRQKPAPAACKGKYFVVEFDSREQFNSWVEEVRKQAQ